MHVAHCLAAGVSLSLTVASLAATTALLVYVRRQRQQLALLQRERSASFTSFQLNPSFSMGGSGPSTITVVDPAAAADGKLATLHTFNAATGQAAAGQAKHPKLAKALSIIPTWTDEHSGYIQVSGGSRRAVSQGSGQGLLPSGPVPWVHTCAHHLQACVASVSTQHLHRLHSVEPPSHPPTPSRCRWPHLGPQPHPHGMVCPAVRMSTAHPPPRPACRPLSATSGRWRQRRPTVGWICTPAGRGSAACSAPAPTSPPCSRR